MILHSLDFKKHWLVSKSVHMQSEPDQNCSLVKYTQARNNHSTQNQVVVHDHVRHHIIFKNFRNHSPFLKFWPIHLPNWNVLIPQSTLKCAPASVYRQIEVDRMVAPKKYLTPTRVWTRPTCLIIIWSSVKYYSTLINICNFKKKRVNYRLTIQRRHV